MTNSLHRQGNLTTVAVDYVCANLRPEQGGVLVAVNITLAFIGTFGNILIILAVLTTPQLRQRSGNFLFLSLAVADLLATMIAQPLFATTIALKTFAHRCVPQVDQSILILSPFSGSSSVYHLAAISIDRVIATAKPHNYRTIMNKAFKVMLLICWGTAVAMGCLNIPFRKMTYILSIVLLLISYTVMLFSYAIIVYKIKNPNITSEANQLSSSASERAMEKRVSGTIAIVILLFLVCWLPFVLYILPQPDHVFTCGCDAIGWGLDALWLSNSSMNFIVYSWRIQLFRTAHLRIIKQALKKLHIVN